MSPSPRKLSLTQSRTPLGELFNTVPGVNINRCYTLSPDRIELARCDLTPELDCEDICLTTSSLLFYDSASRSPSDSVEFARNDDEHTFDMFYGECGPHCDHLEYDPPSPGPNESDRFELSHFHLSTGIKVKLIMTLLDKFEAIFPTWLMFARQAAHFNIVQAGKEILANWLDHYYYIYLSILNLSVIYPFEVAAKLQDNYLCLLSTPSRAIEFTKQSLQNRIDSIHENIVSRKQQTMFLDDLYFNFITTPCVAVASIPDLVKLVRRGIETRKQQSLMLLNDLYFKLIIRPHNVVASIPDQLKLLRKHLKSCKQQAMVFSDHVLNMMQAIPSLFFLLSKVNEKQRVIEELRSLKDKIVCQVLDSTNLQSIISAANPIETTFATANRLATLLRSALLIQI